MMTIPAYGTTAINHIIYRELGSRLRQTANGKREFVPPPPPGGYCKTSIGHRKNSKQSEIVAIDSCFALFGARQYGVTTRDQALMIKYPRSLILALT